MTENEKGEKTMNIYQVIAVEKEKGTIVNAITDIQTVLAENAQEANTQFALDNADKLKKKGNIYKGKGIKIIVRPFYEE